jgi:sRNA-binding regulator protein Hfq
MAKKNKSMGGSQKKKAGNPVALIMRVHPHVSLEEAQEIVASGMSYEEWQREQERQREERRKANQERIVNMICTQFPKITRENALEVIARGITPEQYLEEKLQARLEEIRKQRQIQESQSTKIGPKKGKSFGKGKFTGKAKSFAKGKGRGKGKGKGKGKKRWSLTPSQIQRRKEIDELMAKYPELDRAIAGQIVSGTLSYEQWLNNRGRISIKRKPSVRTAEEKNQAFEQKKQRQEQLTERVQRESHLGETGNSYLETQINTQEMLVVHRFHGNIFRGRLLEIEPFRIVLCTEQNPRITLVKRYISTIVKHCEQEQIYKQWIVCLTQRARQQIPYHDPKGRYDISEELLQLGAQLSIITHDGILFSGILEWFDRFQFMLQLPEGGQVFVFRHAVHRAQVQSFAPEGASMPYLSFITNPVVLPDVHPKELPPSAIDIPCHYNDYHVRDPIYHNYLQKLEEGNFTIEPIVVRRESDHYVLVDGYRRLTLAREKNLDVIPIVVI